MGINFVKAILPEQDINSGIVRIYFVEPVIGKINIHGINTTRRSFILSRLNIDEGEFYDLDMLKKDLISLNFTSDIRARMALRPGNEFASTDLEFYIYEPEKTLTFVMFDDSGSEETGDFRTTILREWKSISGKRDDITLNVVHSEGSLDYLLSYEFFTGKHFDKIGISLRRTETDIISGQLKTFNIESELDGFTIFYKRPFQVSHENIKNFIISIENSDSRTYFSGIQAFENKTTKLSIKQDSINIIKEDISIIIKLLSMV